MLFNFFKISILSLCIIILIHYIINYSQNILTKPKIIDYRKKIKKEEEKIKINIEEKEKHIIDFMKEEKEEHIIDFMKEELTEYLNKIK
jgi:ATP/ADP translocase